MDRPLVDFLFQQNDKVDILKNPPATKHPEIINKTEQTSIKIPCQ